MKRSVALLVFPDVEVLDAAGPFEVFSVASELHDQALFEVRLVAVGAAPVPAVNGLRLLPDATLDEVSAADVVIVPGGFGSRAAAADAHVLDWLRQWAPQAECLLSICTGARVLAAAGLLAGRRYTTHHQAWDALAATPDATLVRGVRFVEDGRLVAAAGISAGIDASLYVVSRLCGIDIALATARYMEYDWRVRTPEQPERSGDLAIRYATAADVDAIVAIAHASYRGEASRAGWTTEADYLDGQRTDAEAVAAMLAGGQGILLAERDGELLGCCQIERDGDACWFGLFAVPPKAQGQGVGNRLLAAAERWAFAHFDAARMRMKVIWLREELIAWYLRRGYRRTGASHPFPYGDPRYGLPRRDDLHFIELAKPLSGDWATPKRRS